MFSMLIAEDDLELDFLHRSTAVDWGMSGRVEGFGSGQGRARLHGCLLNISGTPVPNPTIWLFFSNSRQHVESCWAVRRSH